MTIGIREIKINDSIVILITFIADMFQIRYREEQTKTAPINNPNRVGTGSDKPRYV
jgi:hypothetical protein